MRKYHRKMLSIIYYAYCFFKVVLPFVFVYVRAINIVCTQFAHARRLTINDYLSIVLFQLLKKSRYILSNAFVSVFVGLQIRN